MPLRRVTLVPSVVLLILAPAKMLLAFRNFLILKFHACYIFNVCTTMLNALSSNPLPQTGGLGPLSFSCPGFSHSFEEINSGGFFPPSASSNYIRLPLSCRCFLVLTNEVGLSVKRILAISISCAASHWCRGSLVQRQAA